MSLRVVGAGLGRTGTNSLKVALERLLGAPCYHMMEVFTHPEHVPVWHAAARGRMPDWGALLAGFAAAVDWPVAAFWPELSAAFPDAVVLLSVREPQSWWQSASETIFPAIAEQAGTAWRAMIDDLFAARFTSAIDDRATAVAAFERHNARVRATVPARRLVEWRAADGWAPLCAALGVPVPSEPFPHTNTRADWRARNG
ncbi:MAG TPA: sulfotransferase [Candidatus Binatia bacterium]|nr:sulfotransferase [Candidatus Binatia bacterium]